MPIKPCGRSTAGALLGFGLLVAVSLTGCSKPRQLPVSEPPGYLALQDALGDFDFTPLAGRRLVLDPGHGGFFRGAIGQDGLTEAEVNLGVALYLRGLLEWAGAEVFLTRTADFDFLTPADSSLTADLAARVALADSIRPDVFLSIHHNSNAELDRDLNETQTYHPVGREGADLDLARSIHKYLVRNLQIEPAKILAGNFYVLRNATVPAVLGEPSMISNPVIEKRLSLAAKQELEAKAYFLGLLEYFSGGTPRFEIAGPDSVDGAVPDGRGQPLVWRFDPGGPGSPGLDPTSLQVVLDGRPQIAHLGTDGVSATWWPPLDLSAGSHQLTVRGRNLAGRATPDWQGPVHLGTAGGLRSRLVQLVGEQDSGPSVLLHWRSLDGNLSDLGEVQLGDGRSPEVPGRRLPRFAGPDGWLLLPATELPDDPELRLKRSDGTTERSRPTTAHLELPGRWRWYPLGTAAGVWPGREVPGDGWRIRWLADRERIGAAALQPDAPVFPCRQGTPFWLEAAGALPLVADGDHRPPWGRDNQAPPDTFFWRPLLPALVGKVVFLDPTGGGSDTDSTGPLGTRGADLNLQVAEKTASLLRGAGAEVFLTRRDETWIPPAEKVRRSNEMQADLFLVIGRSQDPQRSWTAHHHHGSRAGETWADRFARAVMPLIEPPDSVRIAPSYAYLLRHTACPALAVGLQPPVTVDLEERLLDPSYQQAVARALLLSVAALLGGEDIFDTVVDPGRILATREDLFGPVEQIDWVRLDGNFLWLPPRWRAENPISLSSGDTPGLPAPLPEHFLEIRRRDDWQLWAWRHGQGGSLEFQNLSGYWPRPSVAGSARLP